VAELLVAGVEEFLDALVGEDEELALERVAKNLCGGIVVAVGAAVGSAMISSTMPSSLRSVDMIFMAMAAVSAFVESRQMMDAQPSGEITE